MNNIDTRQQGLRPGEEEALEGLLRNMSPVAEPPPEVRERIRKAVAAEWRATISPAPVATRRWQRPALAVAASLAIAAIALGVVTDHWRPSTPAAPTLATLVRISGPVEAAQGERSESRWRPVVEGQPLAVGQDLVTGPGGKAALALPRGVSLRLDADTRIRLVAIDRVVVSRGAVYLDAGVQSAAGADGIRIDTPFGTTRHLGTQYEVRVLPAAMRVSVREGRVESAPSAAVGARPVVAQAGERLVVGINGGVARSTVSPRDSGWSWITDVTPPYSIEDRHLDDFLAWVCRETGRELHFATADAEATARSIILRGSVAGLSPDEALSAVMATTSLTYEEQDGRLIVLAGERRASLRH